MQELINQIKLITQRTWAQFILFSSILWLVFVHLQINRHLEKIIIGYHYWRKSDTYAQITNYYYNGLNFFDHSLYFNQFSSGGKALAEFPLFYYFVAAQEFIFGHHELVAKVNWILVLFFGLFAVFKIAYHFFNHFILSLVIALSFFLSPVFTIYAIDFLPDPIALNFCFIGLWFFLKFSKEQKKRWLILALFFISFAGMVKPFFLIPFIAILITIIINQLFFKVDFQKFKWQFLIPFAAIAIWFFYVKWYNSSVGSNYFLAAPRPIWNYSGEEIALTKKMVLTNWLSDYIHPKFLFAFCSLVLINLFWWTKKNMLLSIFYITSVIGCFLFAILFFNMFESHDYYIYPILFIVPLTIGTFIYKILQKFKHRFVLHSMSILTFVLLYFSLDYVWERTQSRRANSHINSTYEFENYQNTNYFLSQHGVSKDDFIFAPSDNSPSFALSLMDRKGWSGFQLQSSHWDTQKIIDAGANYMILNKRSPKTRDTLLIENYLNYFIADTNDIYLYNLQPYRTLKN